VKRLQLVAQIFANALARKRADQAQRESEARLSLAADAAAAGLWSLDKSVRWMSSRGSVECDPSGKPLSLMGVTMDITDRKRAEKAFRFSEARLEAGVDLAGLGCYEVDFLAPSCFADDRFHRICGVPAGRQLGLQPLEFWLEHLHPEDRQRVLDERQKLHDGRLERISIEYRYLHPIEGTRWIDHSARVSARDATGRTVRSFGAIRDITTRKQSEEALLKSYAEIERLKDRLQAESDYLKAEVKVTHAHGEIIGRSPRADADAHARRRPTVEPSGSLGVQVAFQPLP
jgi:PAS domain S-box-containing protein